MKPRILLGVVLFAAGVTSAVQSLAGVGAFCRQVEQQDNETTAPTPSAGDGTARDGANRI